MEHLEAEHYLPFMNAAGLLTRDYNDDEILALADIMGHRHPSDIRIIPEWSQLKDLPEELNRQ